MEHLGAWLRGAVRSLRIRQGRTVGQASVHFVTQDRRAGHPAASAERREIGGDAHSVIGGLNMLRELTT
jgi:hypothetical protein